MDYTINISSINVLENETSIVGNYQNVVKSINFTLSASDGVTSVSENFSIELSDVDTNTVFTEYESLTEGQMKGWIQDSIHYEVYKFQVEKKYKEQSYVNKQTFPWQ
jgi:hypothetical protein